MSDDTDEAEKTGAIWFVCCDHQVEVQLGADGVPADVAEAHRGCDVLCLAGSEHLRGRRGAFRGAVADVIVARVPTPGIAEALRAVNSAGEPKTRRRIVRTLQAETAAIERCLLLDGPEDDARYRMLWRRRQDGARETSTWGGMMITAGCFRLQYDRLYSRGVPFRPDVFLSDRGGFVLPNNECRVFPLDDYPVVGGLCEPEESVDDMRMISARSFAAKVLQAIVGHWKGRPHSWVDTNRAIIEAVEQSRKRRGLPAREPEVQFDETATINIRRAYRAGAASLNDAIPGLVEVGDDRNVSLSHKLSYIVLLPASWRLWDSFLSEGTMKAVLGDGAEPQQE